MQKDDNKVIDEIAQEILRAKLPKVDWQVYSVAPDYAKDYLIEGLKEGRLSGVTVIVQLKGQRALHLNAERSHISFRLETKYLGYYEKQRLPVFLVVVDVTARTAYWLFLQRYTREELREKDWRSQKSITLKVSVLNVLDNVEHFSAEVVTADGYMAKIHPAAIDGAIKAEQERLSNLDPRLQVKLTASEDRREYHIVPKEPVSVHLTFHTPNDEARTKVGDLLKRGLPVTFNPGELEISGSSLFGEAARQPVTMQFSPNVPGPGVLLISSLNPRTGVTTHRCTLTANTQGGPEEIRIETGNSQSPLHLVLTVRRDEAPSFRMGLNTYLWANHSLMELEMFDELSAIVAAIDSGEDLVTQYMLPGFPPLEGTASHEQFCSTSATLREWVGQD